MTSYEGEILDLLTETVKRVRIYGTEEARNVYCRMNDSTRNAFDLYLVRTGDPLAYQAGTGESRFFERVKRMLVSGR